MFNKSAFTEVSESIVDDAQSLMDGNFAIIEQRYILELLLIDEEIPVISIHDAGDFVFYEPSSLNDFNSKNEKRRYFTGDEISDSATEAYYTMIRHRNVAEFLSMFDK